MQFARRLPVIAEPDVLVCGAGCAGLGAAIAAGRLGVETMIVERTGYAGGYLSNVTGAALDGFVDLRTGAPVVGGIAFELAHLTAGAPADVAGGRYPPSNDLRELREAPDRIPLRFNLELLKLHGDRLMQEAGVRILYHTQIADAIREGDRVTGVVVANKGGLGVIRAKTVVDCTGDADVAAWAGAPFEINDEMQPMSLHFRVANISAVSADLRDRCAAVLDRAHAEGELGLYGGPWMGRLHHERELYFNATRFAGNGIAPDDLTAAEIRCRQDAQLMFELFREYVPEFRDAYFVSSGPVVGVRETRRITGDATLTYQDIAKRRSQPDVVLLGAWYVDRHPKASSGYHVHGVVRPYDIAYRTLLPQGLANVWVAGRCHSADQLAMASSRVTITALGMGQAAGTAAGLAAARGADSRSLPVADLQARLTADGVIILERAAQVLAVGDALGDAIPASMPR